MADSSFVQSNFQGGEFSPFAQGRTDLPSYRFGMNVCRNGYPLQEGAWVRRSGTRHSGPTYLGGVGRVMSFDFEKTSPYVLEFTDGKLRMRAVSTQTGGLTNPLPNTFRLVTTNDNQQIAGISTATPAVVQTSGAHGWATNDQVTFLFGDVTSANATPLLCNRIFTVTVVDPTHVSIADGITGAAIDGSTLGWSAVTAPLGSMVIARALMITVPYVSSQWSTLRSVQAETQLVLLHTSYLPRALTVLALPTASAFSTFTFTSVALIDGPYLDPPTDGTTITPNALTGAVQLTASSVAPINKGLGFLATDVGRLIRLRSEPADWAVGTAYIVGDAVKFNGAYFTCIQAGTGFKPDVYTAYWTIDPTVATWSWAIITVRTSSTVVTAVIHGPNLLYVAAIKNWRLGVYSDTTGYPTCGVYYQGRLWLGGAVANRFDASRSNAIFDMTPTAADGTVADDNAISYIFNADDVNPILWMAGAANGINCGTLSGEWLINAPTAGPITPTNISAQRGTEYGSENIEAIHSGLTLIFVQRFARSLLEYFPDVFSARYTAPNLSKTGKHLTVTGVREIRYQQELTPIIWGRCADGSLFGVTYERSNLFSSQGPEFAGWHRHDLGSGRLVESISTGPSPDGTLDTLAMVTTRASNGVRHVELMESLFDVDADIKSGWFLDDAIVPSGGTITSVSNISTLTLYGLWNLNGQSVSVQCGGADAGDGVVSDGSVSVNIDTNLAATFTPNYLNSISSTTAYGALTCAIVHGIATYYVPCIVGFTYISQGQILRPDTVEQTKSPTGPALAKPRRIHQFGALLAGTQGVSFGTRFDRLNAAIFKSPGGTPYTPIQLFNGVYWNTLNDDYGFDSMLCWQIDRPYPCALVSLAGFLNTQDR